MTRGEAAKKIVKVMYGQKDKDALKQIEDWEMMGAILHGMEYMSRTRKDEDCYISSKVAHHAIDLYKKAGGEAYQVNEGIYGFGDWALYGDGMPTFKIVERGPNKNKAQACIETTEQMRLLVKTHKEVYGR